MCALYFRLLSLAVVFVVFFIFVFVLHLSHTTHTVVEILKDRNSLKFISILGHHLDRSIFSNWSYRWIRNYFRILCHIYNLQNAGAGILISTTVHMCIGAVPFKWLSYPHAVCGLAILNTFSAIFTVYYRMFLSELSLFNGFSCHISHRTRSQPTNDDLCHVVYNISVLLLVFTLTAFCCILITNARWFWVFCTHIVV